MSVVPSRTMEVLPVGFGAAVAEVFPALRALLDGQGPALLPVPADDPVRTRLLCEALAPGTPIDAAAALVVATSGSTGTPKGAMLSLAALRASAQATAARLHGPGRWILALPAHHIAGLQVVLRSLAAGYPPFIVDVSSGFNPADLVSAAHTLAASSGSQPLYISLIPGQLRKVLDWPDPGPAAALQACAAVLLGGAAAPARLLERAEAARIRVVRTYGSSETAGGCVYDGRPLAGVRVEVDAARRVWLGGDTIALGYRNAPGHPAFARPGWFRTDDAGEWMDADDPGAAAGGAGSTGARLRILGRLDSALSVGGLTIVPQVVERALLTHPAIAEAVVVGIPHPRLGQRVAALVQLADGAPRPPLGDLRAVVRRELGDHAAPAVVDVIDTMPLLPGGKPDRLTVARLLGA